MYCKDFSSAAFTYSTALDHHQQWDATTCFAGVIYFFYLFSLMSGVWLLAQRTSCENPAVNSSCASLTSLKMYLVKLVISSSQWVWASQPASPGSLSELVSSQPATSCFKTYLELISWELVRTGQPAKPCRAGSWSTSSQLFQNLASAFFSAGNTTGTGMYRH